MPWNGLGSYVLPVAFSPEVSGTLIEAGRYNGLTSDVATGISACLAKNGENTPTADLPMGGKKHTGAANAAVAGEYLVYGQVFPSFSTAGTITLTALGTPLVLNSGVSTGLTALAIANNGGFSYIGNASSVGSGFGFATTAYALCLGTANARGVNLYANSTLRLGISAAGEFSIVAPGGTIATAGSAFRCATNGGFDLGLSTNRWANCYAINFFGTTFTGAFVGNVTGNVVGDVTGNVTGSSGSCTGNAATATVAVSANSADSLTAGALIGGIEVGYRKVPAASVTSGSIPAVDSGKCVFATAGVTIPNATFARGDVVTIYNNTGADIIITAGITTLRLSGTASTGNRTLAQRGMATVLFNSNSEAAISGAGVT